MAAFASPAAATPGPGPAVMFDFNSNNIPSSINCVCSTTGTDPVGASNFTIASYMTQVLLNAGYTNVYVSVEGAIGQMGAPPNSTANKSSNGASYTGDGHVIEDPGQVRPVTLSDSEHYVTGTTNQSGYPALPAPDSNGYDSGAGFTSADGSTGTIAGNQPTASDGYIKNCTSTDTNNAGSSTCSPKGYTGGSAGTNSSSNQSSDILIKIGTMVGGVFQNYLTVGSQKYQVQNISFDYEVFPDGSCTDDLVGSSTSNPAYCGGTGHPNLPNISVYAGDQASGGIQLINKKALDTSPTGNSPAMSGETAPQGLGTVTGLSAGLLGGDYNNNPNANIFDFVDWPATIGIDNWGIVTTAVPEPGTLVLFGFGLLGLAGIARRRRASSVG